MKFYPNSNGEPLKEFNPNHEPKGKTTGGQFAKKQDGTGPSFSINTQPKGEIPKPAEQDPMEKPAGHNISHISGSGEFEGHDVRTIAKNLVRGTDVKFTVDIEIEEEGGSSGSDDGFEFDPSNYESRDTKRAYEQYQEGRYEEASDQTAQEYDRFKGKMVDHLDNRYEEIQKVFDEVVASKDHPYGDTSLVPTLDGGKFKLLDDANSFDTDPLVEQAFAALKGDNGRVVRSDDSTSSWRDPLSDTDKANLREVFEKSNFSSVYGAKLPSSLNEDLHGKINEFLDGDNGFDKWREYGNEVELDVKSYHDWLRSEYEDSARQDYKDNNYSGDGSSGNTTKVKFEYNGANGEQVTRTMFRNDNGELEVHHDFFTVDMTDSPKGLGKALFRSMVAEYERIGIERISVYANIDVGNYAWGKYGFEPDSPTGVILTMVRKLESTPVGTVMDYRNGSTRGGDAGGSVSAVLTERRKAALTKLLSRSDKVEAFWSVLDSDVPGVNTKTGERESFKLGKWFMIQGRQSWDGHIDVSDTRGMDRLKTYIGAAGYLKKVKKGQKRVG